MTLDAKDLLLAPRLEPQQVIDLLSPYGFRDTRKADANLQAMAAEPSERQLLAEILADVLTCISRSADPDQALNYLERFARAALNKTRLFAYFGESPQALEMLSRCLGASPYMAEILIRDPQLFYWLAEPELLQSVRNKRDIQRQLAQWLRVLEDQRTPLDYPAPVTRRQLLH